MKCLPAFICASDAMPARFARGTETQRDLNHPAWLMARLNALNLFIPVQGVLMMRIERLPSFWYFKKEALLHGLRRSMPHTMSKFGPPLYPRRTSNVPVPLAHPQSSATS